MNEALERARAAYGTGAYDDATIEFLFPELKESEDERARKEIIEFIRSQIEDGNSAGWDRWIAYLEKQKEQKPAEWSEEDETHRVHLVGLLEEVQKWAEQDGMHHLCVARCRESLSWLKSLRPSWRPSEEQIQWLESAVKLSTDKPHIHGIIISLYEQLKRL